MRLALLLLILLTVLFLPIRSEANSTVKIDLADWASTPILHDGRIKPIDSFARIYLKTFSAAQSIDGLSATQWLAETLFTPDVAAARPIFKIYNYEQFYLNKKKSNLYSYLELSELIKPRLNSIQELTSIDSKEWSTEQTSLMELYEHYIIYTQLLRSLTLILPLNINASDLINTDKTLTNYIDIAPYQSDITANIKKTIKNKGTNLRKYSEDEKQRAELSFNLKAIESGGVNNNILRVISLDGRYISPWELFNEDSDSVNQLQKWQNLSFAYREDNQQIWSDTLTKVTISTRLKVEHLFNQLNLIKHALTFYIICFFLIIVKTFVPSNLKFPKVILGTLIIGVTLHFVHLLLRVYILERAPVGTLYESIIFVSFGCVFAALFMEIRQKNMTGALLGALSGALLLLTANSFASPDTMGTLVAVLNTNFWLYTHVLCITLGYSWCLISSLLAHFYLVKKAFLFGNQKQLKAIQTSLKTFLILSLLFTAIGTILGGIWADQSWGRFWGWDPKENGALLIVLWLIWILHGRISNHLSRLSYVVASAYLSIVVVIAWFGVNLLNVGLHSYGFTEGITIGIVSFCLLEIIITSGLWIKIHRRKTISEN